MARPFAVFLGVALLAPAALGEPGRERLVLVGAGTSTPVTVSELASVVRTYVQGMPAEIVVVEQTLPVGSFETVRRAVVEIAARSGATMAVWFEQGHDGHVLLYVLDIEGDTAVVRTIRIEEQEPATLQRTMAAVVRTVVDTGLLETAAAAEDLPARGGAERAEQAAPLEAAGAEPRSPGPAPAHLVVEAAYSVRIRQGPGPDHHTLGVALWTEALEWLVATVSARIGLPADLSAGPGGTAWHAAAQAGVGVGHEVRMLYVGGVAGLDLEWLGGEARTGQADQVRSFECVNVGILLRALAHVTLWRGLELHVAIETVIRPERRLFLMHGTRVASSGFAEAGITAGLGWRFF